VDDAWVDQETLRSTLAAFFESDKQELSLFGSTVNQVFEAYVFAQVISAYKQKLNWTVELMHPHAQASDAPGSLRLKFSTRGRPANYSHVKCTSPSGVIFQIRHQLRVATKHHRESCRPAANICLDVAVIDDRDLSGFSTSSFVDNAALRTFGEAKHMSAFAELVAGFIGLVHEMQPHRLKRVRIKHAPSDEHPAPFLFVSGHLWNTAEGIYQTIQARKMDVDIYTQEKPLCAGGIDHPEPSATLAASPSGPYLKTRAVG
jgi:hypothetical protein